MNETDIARIRRLHRSDPSMAGPLCRLDGEWWPCATLRHAERREQSRLDSLPPSDASEVEVMEPSERAAYRRIVILLQGCLAAQVPAASAALREQYEMIKDAWRTTKRSLAAARSENEELRSAIRWMSGADDFAPGGKAHEAWLKLRSDLFITDADGAQGG